MPLPDRPKPHTSTAARDALLAKFALYSHPAMWPRVQIALMMKEALGLPIAMVAWMTESDQTAVLRFLSQGRRRIKAFRLVEHLAVGRAWPAQLEQIHRFIGGLLELAGTVPKEEADRRSKLVQIAYQMSSYLADHSLAGTPASHDLRRRARRQLEAVTPVDRLAPFFERWAAS